MLKRTTNRGWKNFAHWIDYYIVGSGYISFENNDNNILLLNS